MSDKVQQLQELARVIESCSVCKKDSSGKMVFGEGDANAKVMFVGEAPGKNEAATGRPFIGRSGKFLRSLIAKIGLEEVSVYITSPVKYLPDRGTPSKQQIEHARTHFQQQLRIIHPKIVVLLGSTAIQAVLDEKLAVTKFHGTTREEKGAKYFLTFHPAAAIRFTKIRRLIEEDFQKLQNILE